ncbi:TPA: M15 family peptidase [Acinetobacter baumannii]|nr:M15 family peptidase [Acinetobacter baumannii]
MSFKLGKRSLSNLEGVHPDLVKVVNRAIELTQVDFTVIEGLRTKERQAQLLKEKKTTTKNSRHLTGHAVDLAAWVDNTVSWEWKYYYQIADAMKKAALELKIPIEWGGDWKTFKDGPHFQLPFKQYPKP